MSEHWKRFESTVAKLFGTVRIPVNGRGDEPDLKTSTHTVECKHWGKLPARVESALKQAENANTPGALPLAVIGGRGRPWREALVVMRLSDYIDWYSPRSGDQEDEPVLGEDEGWP